ncbi:MAG: DNA replication and repair protein recF [uncultured bacterium]|nr:MAG: DNA replication and repair protein recF [uncultured bacterium]OGJ46973.1 MAG: hypothetical protein A2244_04500 [Candidatus Peregrinibacteria bacterium RIFOXYA2_FULL_41_18]OGJ49391.1 MAG: hypothetical protein A2344_03115 [Candidatus Peregrinibacteria bacterium RIFOXYB12_FULL_41_12]OGJ53603.1 MAG: hypothetical protein A2448_02965 [Candidatus Peregrinibacteria bacterium RIFOXYC2_FULL_41_22]OGJ54058.1 MAG: hypothetical protein A2336_02115 [Candidatus Peregrinibacteria bacterium RIFOXYB2_FUL
MFISRLELENFRNFPSLDLNFSEEKNLTVLFGENGQGKTNILESIYSLALTRSFRTKNFQDAIMWGREHGRIKGEIANKERTHKLEIAFTGGPSKQKRLKKEGVTVESKKYLHHLTAVMFSPEDVHIIIGEPDDRRKYLNLIGVQVFRGFLEILVSYNRALKNRNEILKSIAKGRSKIADLEIWDECLAETGLEIFARRQEILDYIGNKMNAKYHELSGNGGEIDIQRKTYIPLTKEEYLSRLNESQDFDIRMHKTNFGPHRDDFMMTLGGHEIKKFCSRGECRTIVLALKLIEMEFVEGQTGEKPILLLDDVLSELDHKHQEHLIKAISGYQTFLTTTCAEHLDKFGGNRIEMVEVRSGVCTHADCPVG